MLCKAPIVCLCGSTKHRDLFEYYRRRLTLEGKVVLDTGGVYGHTDDDIDMSGSVKKDLDRLHFQKIIVADEAFSMLDVSMRSQVVNLLLKLQERLGLSYVVVANDLGLVRHISDKVLIMHQGEIVESGLTSEVFSNPQHDVTKRLIQNHGHEYRR